MTFSPDDNTRMPTPDGHAFVDVFTLFILRKGICEILMQILEFNFTEYSLAYSALFLISKMVYKGCNQTCQRLVSIACVEKVLKLDTAMLVEKHNQTFQLAKKTADTWLKSYTKACADVGGFLEGNKSQAQKDQDQLKKDEEKKEIAAAKAQAKEARTKMKSAEQLKGAIFGVDDGFFNSIPDVTVAAVKQGSTADIQKPWVIRKCPEVDKWKNEPGMILRLSEYGGAATNGKQGRKGRDRGHVQEDHSAECASGLERIEFRAGLHGQRLIFRLFARHGGLLAYAKFCEHVEGFRSWAGESDLFRRRISR